jgi:hypothetical protein
MHPATHCEDTGACIVAASNAMQVRMLERSSWQPAPHTAPLQPHSPSPAPPHSHA